MSAPIHEELANDLDAKCRAIGTVLAGVDAARQASLLAKIVERIVNHSEQIRHRVEPGSPAAMVPTPEILEWARGLFTEEEAIAGLREIRQTGGLKFGEVIHGLESPASDG
jgi:hypothetical protein